MFDISQVKIIKTTNKERIVKIYMLDNPKLKFKKITKDPEKLLTIKPFEFGVGYKSIMDYFGSEFGSNLAANNKPDPILVANLITNHGWKYSHKNEDNNIGGFTQDTEIYASHLQDVQEINKLSRGVFECKCPEGKDPFSLSW